MPESAHSRPPATTVGLVAGLGPESTIDYYRRLLAAWERRFPGTAPSMVIDSLDVQHVMRLVADDRAALVRHLLVSLGRLERAGCRFAAITANTPHVVFDELAPHSPIPLLSIVETCADEAARRGRKRLLILGSRFTMEGSFYPDAFARRLLKIVVPDEAEREWVHDRYVGELLAGDFRDETRREFETLIRRIRERHQIDGVILGGTELPLLLRSPTVADVPALDTTALHVEAIVARLSLDAAARPTAAE